QAVELMPEVLSNPEVEIRYAINGLLSLTPDGPAVLGESPEVAGLWSAAAVWVKEGPGVGRAVDRKSTRLTPVTFRARMPSAAWPRPVPTSAPFPYTTLFRSTGRRTHARGPVEPRGRDPVCDQRAAVADPGRSGRPRRIPRGRRPVVGGRRVGQGGPGSRPSGGRVDDARSARDRRPGRRHRPLPLPSAHPLPCAGAHLGGLQQDLRHRPPCRAVELRSQHPPLPHARAGEGTVSSVLRSRRLGATAVVRIEREPARGVRRRRDGP